MPLACARGDRIERRRQATGAPNRPATTTVAPAMRKHRQPAQVRSVEVTALASSQPSNISTDHSRRLPVALAGRCSSHLRRTAPPSKNLRAAQPRGRQQVASAHGSQRARAASAPIGTPNPILGRSISSRGTCRSSSCRRSHLPSPPRTFTYRHPPGKLGHAVIEERRARLQVHAIAMRSDLHQDVVGQVAGEVDRHAAIERVESAAPRSAAARRPP